MKKAGILTFHRASNYGAVLQTYALQKTIEQLGYSAEVIDYRCPAIEEAHNPFYFRKGKKIKSHLKIPIKFLKYRKFSEFRNKYIKLSGKVEKDNVQNSAADYSLIIAGSDQIWNSFNSGLDETYFLPFDRPEKKYSYAASLGDSYDIQTTTELLKKYASRFTTISLREESALEFVSSVTGIECRIDVDPTLLLSKSDWMDIARKPKNEKPYILIYTLAPSSLLVKKAKEMSAITGWDIVFLDNSFIKNLDMKRTRFSAPDEFIGWFSGASFVFTNSFHGTAFSLIMNRPFVVDKNANHGVNKRSADLIKKVELENKIVSENMDITKHKDIEWSKVNQLLLEYGNSGRSYLRSMFVNTQ